MAPGVGWSHGPIPDPPDGLLPRSVEVSRTWFGSWVAAFWTAGDVPGLRVVIQLFDAVERGRWSAGRELRLWSDSYGITPKGQSERRWQRPNEPHPAPDVTPEPYRHLRVV